MRSGTPGFVGARLREAREARGLTAIALSELLGISRAAVSQYESGQVSPYPEVMDRIANILRFPHAFFMLPPREGESGTVFFRSMSTATKSARIKGYHRYHWLVDTISYLQQFVRLPNVSFPDIEVPRDFNRLSSSRIEAVASEVRHLWNLGSGPISDITLLMENKGAIVSRIPFGTADLDGFSTWCLSDGRPYFVLSNEKESAVRSRYDVGHELGHLVLHRDLRESRLNSTSDFRLIESQAHRFASAFLLPAASFANDFTVPTLDSLRALKPKWLVSIGMMIYRARELEFIDEGQATRLWISYRRRWSKREPLDDKLKIEEPRLLRRAFELVIDSRLQTRGQVTTTLPYQAMDIEELANLPSGYLQEDSPYVCAISNLSPN